MNSLQYRRRHTSKPTLESLDDRIVPSAAGSAIHAQALEARAIHIAEVRAARADHRAEIQTARLQRLDLRAEHLTEIQAGRAQQRELQLQHRASRIQARQDYFAMLHAGRAQNNYASAGARHQVALSQGRVGNPVLTNLTSFNQFPSVATTGNSAANVSDAAATSGSAAYSATTSSSTNSMSTSPSGAAMETANSSATTPVDINDVKNGPMAKAGQNLIQVYNQYQDSGGSGDFVLTGYLANMIRIQGDSVGVDVGTAPGNLANVSSTLTALGMQITATDATTGTIEGFLPIVALPTVSQNNDVLTLSPNYLPAMSPPPSGGFQPR